MKLLVVGGGGREHAMLDKLRADAPSARLFAAPGNPGTARIAENLPLSADDPEALADFAADERVDLTAVGPEGPLAAGIADLFRARGLPLFGPTRAAARIESSKSFAKRLMRERDVPTAPFDVFTDADRALDHLGGLEPPFVVKASGLAAGKGAVVCRSRREGRTAVRSMMVEGRFGDAGREVVVEAFLEGEELSVFYLTDGERLLPLAPSRDYKRAREADRGPNTGGMGAYAPAGPTSGGPPAPAASGDAPSGPRARRAELLARVRREIARPVLAALAERGSPYRGLLYCGLMLTAEGPRVVEFNCRFGDPEAQAVLPLTRGSLLEPMLAVARGEPLEERPATSRAADAAVGGTGPGTERSALVTVLASEGYPGPYETGREIRIPPHLEDDPDLRIYHAGTAARDGALVTAGGRVLGVTGLGADLTEAAARSRAAARAIRFRGKRWRRDIGWHELSPAAPAPSSDA